MPDQTPPSLPRTVALDALTPEMRGGAIAIGSFDGVHRGHAALIAAATGEARKHGVPAIVLTFDPHPRTFFRPESPVFRLTPPAARARLMGALGVDTIVVAQFDAAFSRLEPVAFEETVLAGQLGARWVVVGDGFRFGRGRAGTADQLGESGRRLGYEVIVVDAIKDDAGIRVSSSAIREALAGGDIGGANRLLGYRWFVIGEVIRGERRGRELGFPTANMRLAPDCGLRHGIYAVTLTRKGGRPLAAVASYGRRPQFDNGPPLLEVFVFDFSGDLYGEEVMVTFFDWIRAEQVFPSVDELVGAIRRDCEAARAVLAASGPGSALDEAMAGNG